MGASQKIIQGILFFMLGNSNENQFTLHLKYFEIMFYALYEDGLIIFQSCAL